MIAFPGRLSAISMAAMLLMVGFSGAVVGANEAAIGGERVDMYDILHEETFTEDGELQETEPPDTQPDVIADLNERAEELSPDAPGREKWVRQHLVKPMVLGAFVIADVGFTTGYTMVLTIGAGATKVILNGAVLSVLAGVAFYTVQVVRGVAR